jgi:hypothetical protein
MDPIRWKFIYHIRLWTCCACEGQRRTLNENRCILRDINELGRYGNVQLRMTRSSSMAKQSTPWPVFNSWRTARFWKNEDQCQTNSIQRVLVTVRDFDILT